MTEWPGTASRDLTLAYLAMLTAVATGPGPVDPARIAVFGKEGLVAILDELRRGERFLGIPEWLVSTGESGLQLILDAATAVDEDTTGSVPAELARLLGAEMIDDLLSLYTGLEASGSEVIPSTPTVVLATETGQYLATSLWPSSAPVAQHSWFQSITTDHTAAVRETLSPFESLASSEIQSDFDAGHVWPPQVPGRPVLDLQHALAALAHVAEIQVPAGLLAVGDSCDDGAFHALTETEAAACTAAVAHLSCDLLMPTAEGWTLARANGTTSTVADSARGLDTAAKLVWGEEWASWKREQHRSELALLGWVPTSWRDAPPNQLVPDTDVSQVGALFTMFHEGRKFAVLGGTRSSGKSAIVRRFAVRLDKQRRSPLVQVIASVTGELPSSQVALRGCKHALALEEPQPGQRRVLVLEDLRPVGSGDVDSLLPRLSEQLGVSVLAVLRYDPNSNEEWQTDHLNVVTAAVGRPGLREFVRQLCEAHPALNKDAGLAELKRPHATRDVHRLIQIMLGAPADQNNAEPEQDSALATWFRSLDDAGRSAVATIAACSLANGAVGSSVIEVLAKEDLARLGIQPNADGTRWSVASPDDCRAVLVAHQDSQAAEGAPEQSRRRTAILLDATMVDLLLPYLLERCRAGSAEVLPYLKGSRLYRNALCAMLVRRAWAEGALGQWIQQSPPARIAELLVSLNVWLGTEVFRRAITTMVDRIEAQAEMSSLQDTLFVLRCLRDNLSEITPRWRSISSWIQDQVSAMLTADSGSPNERFAVLHQVERFRDPALQEVIADRAIEVLPGLDPARADDYNIVRSVCGLQNRAQRTLGWQQWTIPVDQEEVVQGLLTGEPPETAGLRTVVAWLSLRRYFKQTTWEELLDTHEERFAPAMRYTTPQEFSTTLDELHAFGPAYSFALLMRAFRRDARRRVQEVNMFAEAIRKMLRDSSPIEAANLISSVYNSHSSCARDLLYARPGVPDKKLASLLAARVNSMMDTKGAGMLLSSAHIVDDMYVVDSLGFAHCFGELLGQENALKLLREDPRLSLKYYLLKGLWDAQVPFRRDCLAAARDVVVEAVTTGRKPWGPRLALQIGADADMGQEFLLDLREHVELKHVLAGMEPYASPEAQAEFHRLGRALYPEAADRYLNGFQVDAFLAQLAGATPTYAVECCRQAARTLADADYHDGGRDIVVAADRVLDEQDAWANRLARTRTGEQLAQTLNILMDIDHQTARAAVAAMGHRVRDEDEKSESSLLLWKARHAILDSPTATTSLLKSLELADSGLGNLIYKHLMRDNTLSNVFTFELKLIQSARAQFVAASQLSFVGVRPGQEKTEWMTQVFNAKLGFVPILGNPQVLTDLIKMLAIWRESWGDRAVRAIDHGKVLARLRLALARDVAPAIELAALAYEFGDSAGSTAIIDALFEIDPARIVREADLRKACTLMNVARSQGRPQVAELAAAIDDAIDLRLDQAVVLDEQRQWMEIGHACHALTDAQFTVTAANAPHTAPNMAHHAAVVWGLHGLPTSSWRRRFLDIAAGRQFRRQPHDNLSRFSGLATAVQLGRPEAFGQFADPSAIGHLSFRQLRVLHELAESQPALAALLAPCEPGILTRLAEPTARVDWDARCLNRSLERLRREGEATL